MKLAHAARRATLAGLVTVLSLTVVMDASAQQIAGCDRVTGRPRYDALPQTISRILDNQNARPEDLDLARRDCQAMLSNPQQVQVSAVMCVARIQLIQARRSEDARRQNYSDARCSAYRASRLARNNAPVNREANGLWAEALVGLLGVGAGDPAVYQAELRSVHNAQASPVVHRAIAQMSLEQNDVAGARNEADGHLRNSPRDRALTLISIARQQARTGESPAVVRQTLEEAYRADQTSLAVNSELGRAYFNLGRSYWGTAEPYLRAAVQINPPPAGDENLQELAYYHLSVIDADRGNLTAALESADNAGNEARALRQVCLVRLMMGGEQVYRATVDPQGRMTSMEPSEEGRRSCTRLGSTAEGQLLEGMFWLRYSQFRGQHFYPVIGSRPDNYTPWNTAIRTAERAFEVGRRQLGEDVTTKLDWPGANDVARREIPNADEITLRAMLSYGDDLADFFQGFCQGDINSTADERAAEWVFVHYKIVRSPRLNRRCLTPELN